MGTMYEPRGQLEQGRQSGIRSLDLGLRGLENAMWWIRWTLFLFVEATRG